MQKDFHYYCVGVLARGAGFNSNDALTIAYASQYVDNATEGGRVPLRTNQGELMFDPVRTAYDITKMKQGLETLEWSAQKRVYLPFHFLPPKPFQPASARSFTYVTEANSRFGRLLLDEAASEPLANRKLCLCRIGVALHAYADSWSHQGFSGRTSTEENNVETIRLYDREKKRWDRLGLANLAFDVLPEIGHAEAGHFPDLTFQRWKCKLPHETTLERDNVETFLKAAKAIYVWLRQLPKDGPTEPISLNGRSVHVVEWSDLGPRVRTQFAMKFDDWPAPLPNWTQRTFQLHFSKNTEKRCRIWKAAFKHWFKTPGDYSYHPRAWRKAALTGDWAWDDYSESDWERASPRRTRRGFWNSLWVNFHRAALLQRHLVLENLP